MPDAADFLVGFNLFNGRQIAGFTLQQATSTHETVSRYHEYRYNISLTFIGDGNYTELIRTLQRDISQSKIIFGIKNPYRCVIDPISEYNVLRRGPYTMISLVGHSYRA